MTVDKICAQAERATKVKIQIVNFMALHTEIIRLKNIARHNNEHGIDGIYPKWQTDNCNYYDDEDISDSDLTNKKLADEDISDEEDFSDNELSTNGEEKFSEKRLLNAVMNILRLNMENSFDCNMIFSKQVLLLYVWHRVQF